MRPAPCRSPVRLLAETRAITTSTSKRSAGRKGRTTAILRRLGLKRRRKGAAGDRLAGQLAAGNGSTAVGFWAGRREGLRLRPQLRTIRPENASTFRNPPGTRRV